MDSRGHPTVACVVSLVGGGQGRAAIPAGASTGRHEAAELRDGGEAYDGLGVTRAVQNVSTELAAAVIGMNASDQRGIDAALVAADGSVDLGRLGANAVLAVSIATAIAAADGAALPLYVSLVEQHGHSILMPLPMVNIISGGAHAGAAIDVQDFLAVPLRAQSFREAIDAAARVRQATAEVFTERGLVSTLVADEGGLAAPLPTNRAALEILTRGIERAGFVPGTDIGIAIDVAASQLWERGGRYRLSQEDRVLTGAELLAEIRSWCDDFAVVSVEDPVGEDDWANWRLARRTLAGVQLVGDDLIVTDRLRLQRAIDEDCASAVLVKPNQRGTLTAAAEVVQHAQRAGFATVVSARSGETEDSWLADLVVAWRGGQIKVGSTTRSERTAKWNRLLEIEALASGSVSYAGAGALRLTPSQKSNPVSEKNAESAG